MAQTLLELQEALSASQTPLLSRPGLLDARVPEEFLTRAQQIAEAMPTLVAADSKEKFGFIALRFIDNSTSGFEEFETDKESLVYNKILHPGGPGALGRCAAALYGKASRCLRFGRFSEPSVDSQRQGGNMNHVLRCSGYEVVRTDMVRGRDCYLYDAHDKRYVDFEAGVWCTALGHNHWRINRTIRTQIEQIIHLSYRYTNVQVEEAAAEVLDTTALPDGKCIFLSSGSEAVEFGVQIARRITGQPLLLTLSDSYLAAYGSAGRKSPEEWYCFDWGVCVACHHSEECDPACGRLREIPFDRIGGLVFEPGNTSGLVRLPPKQLIQILVRMVKQQNKLVVVDEVTTGLGRTGAWYGFEHYALQPDIIALGKGLGNGYPVSAVVISHGIAYKLENSAFRYAQSHQNDPLGCAVAKEVVTVIREDGLVERSNRVGAHFLRELGNLGERHEIVKEIRGRGLMIAMEFEGNAGHFSLASVYRKLLERGFIVGYKPEANLLRFYPALTIGEEDISKLLENLDQVLKAL